MHRDGAETLAAWARAAAATAAGRRRPSPGREGRDPGRKAEETRSVQEDDGRRSRPKRARTFSRAALPACLRFEACRIFGVAIRVTSSFSSRVRFTQLQLFF